MLVHFRDMLQIRYSWIINLVMTKIVVLLKKLPWVGLDKGLKILSD